jgi:glycosyltransferase involved in cell wall biosynthesis
MKTSEPLVTIVIPCKNEKAYISTCLEKILLQDFPLDKLEILVIDGLSTDGTREIIQSYVDKYGFIRLLDNAKGIVAVAMNIGIANAHGEIIVRLDVHTEYAPDYISKSVGLLKVTCADNVGGPWRAIGKSYMQTAIALSFQSPFSSGGAGSHTLDYEGEVDSVYLGCWEKATLVNIGLFDEELVRNQDDELNLRIVRSGGRVWQSPQIRSWYYPRSSLIRLFRQYMQYGYWKVRIIQKHKFPASIRHLVPGGFVGALLILCLLSLGLSSARLALTMLLVMYLFANLGASLITCRLPENWKHLPVMPLVFAAYHFGYGWGFLRGVLDFFLLNKSGRHSYSQLTR